MLTLSGHLAFWFDRGGLLVALEGSAVQFFSSRQRHRGENPVSWKFGMP